MMPRARGDGERRFYWSPGCGVLLLLAFLPVAGPRAAAATLEDLEIIAPASPGGGWEQTALAMKEVLEATGAVGRVQVVSSPGGGGVVGLAQFVSGRRGDPGVLLVGGAAMAGALGAQHATVSLDDVTPLARLTSEPLVVAVPAGSPWGSLEELLAAMQKSPGSIAWTGSDPGGPDYLLVELLARATGVEPLHVVYVPRTGGGEVAETLLARQVTVGVSGYGEFARYFESGRLRPLGLSSESRLPGVDVPTLRELGIDVVVTNWRGVFAPPDLPDERRRELLGVVDRMARSEAWDYMLRRHRWTDVYLSGPPFALFVRSEEARARTSWGSTPLRPAEIWKPGLLVALRRDIRAWLGSRTVLVVLGGVCVLLVAIVAVRRSGARRERRLNHDLEAARRDERHRRQEIEELHQGLSAEIERQFERWSLTAAEREVASLILRGLKHREIAEMRQTSERTVRQQALSVYKKAGLNGRTDLAAYFLEDLLPPTDSRSDVA